MNEHTGERTILSFDDDALFGPLPELGLGRPELLGARQTMRAVCFRFFLFSFFAFLSLNAFILPAQSVWIRLIDFHYSVYCPAVGYRRWRAIRSAPAS